MNEENMMDDELTQDRRSESAFYWTSKETERTFPKVAPEIQQSNIIPLVPLTENPLKATKYGHSFALLVPKGIIPTHSRPDILEIKVARASEPEREIALYTTHLPGYKHAYLDLYLLGPSKSEEYWIKSVRIYAGSQFAADYNSQKPKGLENTGLSWDGALKLRVDGEDVPLVELKRRAYQGMAVLEAKSEEIGLIKIQRKMAMFEVRLKDHSPVTSLKMKNGAVLLEYRRSQHDHPHVRTRDEFDDQSRTLKVLDQLPPKCLQVVKIPKSVGAPFEVEITEEGMRTVAKSLDTATTLDAYRKTKGRFGEEIVRSLLPTFGMMLIATYPQSPDWWPSVNRRPGTDMLARVETTGELCYIEAKWWGKVDVALADAIDQVRRDYRKSSDFRGEKVRGAYMAVIDWEPSAPVMRVHLVRAV